jgi:hypothetical protein
VHPCSWYPSLSLNVPRSASLSLSLSLSHTLGKTEEGVMSAHDPTSRVLPSCTDCSIAVDQYTLAAFAGPPFPIWVSCHLPVPLGGFG